MAFDPVQKRSVSTKQRLIEAGRAEFDERGWEFATVRGIVDRTGVSTGTFYRYFTDMSAVLRAVAAARYDELLAAIEFRFDAGEEATDALPERFRHRLLRNCERVLQYHRREPGLHIVLTERRRHDPDLDALASQIDEKIRASTAQLLVSLGLPKRDAEPTAFVLLNVIESTIVSVVSSRNAPATQPVFQVIADMVMLMVLTRKDS